MRERPVPKRPGTAVAASLLLLAVGPAAAQRGDLPAPAAAETRPPSVVLISIDTLRSDRLPSYGYDRVATPAIDALARDAILFEHAYSHTPLTLPSHVTVLTGLLPDAHGVRDNQGYPFAAGRFPNLARELRARGWATGGAVSAWVLHRQSGIAAGFDFWDDEIELRRDLALGGSARPGDETLAAVEPWLGRVAAGKPFFLFFHLFEPHMPYAPPEPFASRYRDPYDGEVAAADAVVGRLIARLRELGVYERAAVVLFSDHGEGLGDHGEEEHGIFLYREALQVPLLLKLPGNVRGGERVSTPVGLVDVYPTLLDLLGLPRGVELPGRSLLEPPAETPAEGRAIYAETFYPRLHYGWSELVSVIDRRFHLIDGPGPELFDLGGDPGETRNLASREPRRVAELRRRLPAVGRPLEPPNPVAAETRARLAALGYLGGSATLAEGPLPDPKVQLPTLTPLRTAYAHIRRGDDAAAVPPLYRVLRDNPRMVDGWQALGDALRRLGRLGEARTALGRAFELSADRNDGTRLALVLVELGELDEARQLVVAAGLGDGSAARPLGLALARAGRFDDALAVLRPLAAGGDPAAVNALARVLSEAGDQAAAGEILERLLEREDGNAEGWENLGLVHLRSRRWGLAREASERAVALDPERAEGWNNLGVASWVLGERQAALDAWERAVALDPELWDTLVNLGTRAAELGRREQARLALERFVAGAPPERYGEDLRRARVLLRRLGD